MRATSTTITVLRLNSSSLIPTSFWDNLSLPYPYQLQYVEATNTVDYLNKAKESALGDLLVIEWIASFDLLQELVQNILAKRTELPILICSSNLDEAAVLSLLQAGVYEVLEAATLQKLPIYLARALKISATIPVNSYSVDYTFIEAFSDPILICDFHQILATNTAFLNQFGFEDQDRLLQAPLPLKQLVVAADYHLIESWQQFQSLSLEQNHVIPQIRLQKENQAVFVAELRLSKLVIKGQEKLLVVLRDISTILANQSAMRTSQLKYEYAQRMAKIGSWEFTLATEEVIWSKETYRIFGLQGIPSNMLYQAYLETIHPDDLERLLETIFKSIEQERPFTLEHRIVLNDKQIKYLLCKAEMIRNEKGEVRGFQGTCQDISEQKRIQERLKLQEENNLLIKHINQVPGLIYQFKMTPSGEFSFPFVSNGIYDICGITPEQMVENGERFFMEFLHKDDVKTFFVSGEESMKTLEDWKLDFRIDLTERGIRWLRGNSQPIRLEDGSTLWQGYVNDITKDKLAQKALRESEQQVRTLFKEAPEAIVLLDIDGGITKWNPRAEMIFGWEEAEVIGKKVYDVIVPPERYTVYQDSFESYKARGEGIEFNHTLEVKAVCKNGQRITITLSISKMTIKGKLSLICFMTDITKRKRAAKKIEASLREKEVLLKEIHHRVKNNMQVVTSLLSLQSSFIQDESIQEIFRSSQYRINSMGMVHEMLYQSDNLSKINYSAYLERLIDGLIQAMQKDDVAVSLQLEAPEVLTLNLDTAVPLGLIVNELVTNALKYAFVGRFAGRLEVALEALEYPNFLLSIGDNGVGLPPKKEGAPSKSLGLLLVQRLAVQLKGSIQQKPSAEGTYYELHFQEIEQE